MRCLATYKEFSGSYQTSLHHSQLKIHLISGSYTINLTNPIAPGHTKHRNLERLHGNNCLKHEE